MLLLVLELVLVMALCFTNNNADIDVQTTFAWQSALEFFNSYVASLML